MLYHCSTLTGGATITALLASLERLQIWRPSSHVLHILRHTLSADKKSQYLRLKAITFDAVLEWLGFVQTEVMALLLLAQRPERNHC
jgi:hypothetical protein